MARFERLRWVPMLIRAYYDAQTRIAPTQTAVPNIRTVALSDKKPSSLPAKKQLSKPVKIGQRQRRDQQNPKTNVPERQNDVASRLLRELRATNRKLKGLDDLRQQLKGVGLSLEEFNRRIKEWDSKSVQSQGSPGTRPGPYPAPLDPFRGNQNYAPWQPYPQRTVDKPVDNSESSVQTTL